MINVPFNLAHKITPEYVTEILNRGMMHYTMGMRGYYFSVLLFLWLFGPIWMLLGTIVITIILYHLDQQASEASYHVFALKKWTGGRALCPLSLD